LEVIFVEVFLQTGYSALVTDTATGVLPDSGPLALFTHLARTSLFLEALQEECLEPYGLSFGDYSVLRVLRQLGPPYRLSPKNLADTVVRTSGGMTKIIDRLQRAGLVERLPDPDDRRALLVGLTRKGIRVSDKASDAYKAGRERILRRLSTGETEEIDSSLRRLLAVFEHDHKGELL
jgi:DNA-binding MarR family transcriptional regulator